MPLLLSKLFTLRISADHLPSGFLFWVQLQGTRAVQFRSCPFSSAVNGWTRFRLQRVPDAKISCGFPSQGCAVTVC